MPSSHHAASAGLFWRRLVRHTAGTVAVYGSDNTAMYADDHGPHRHLPDVLLDAGDLSGTAANDLLALLESDDVKCRELAVRALHLVASSR